jgi:LSU ribosomal protein L1P
VLVLCTPDKEQEALAAGADYAGLQEYMDKIQGGWTDIDVVIATPNVMAQVGKIGRILGPRNLMPNPKTGTVTPNVAEAVKEVKSGKISFRVDKYGIVHTSIGRVNFTAEQLSDNAGTELEFVIMVIAVSCVKLLSAHNSTQHTSRKHKV